MNKVRAAVTRAAGLTSVESRPTSRPGLGEVELFPLYVGVCGSDGNIFAGTHPYLHYPIVQGHEFVAEVGMAGPGVEAMPPGTLVAVDPALPCGTCGACDRGIGNACERLEVIGVHRDGGLSESVCVPATAVHDVSGLEPLAAVFVEPLAVALWALRRGAVTPDDRVVVLGAGALGRCVALAVADVGAAVLTVDRSDDRLAHAERLGSMTARIDDLPSDGPRWRPTVAIDTTGSAPTMSSIAAHLEPGGRLIIAGISQQPLDLPVGLFTRRELTVAGTRNSRGTFPEAIGLARRHARTLAETVEHTFPLDKTADALQRVDARSLGGKAFISVRD